MKYIVATKDGGHKKVGNLQDALEMFEGYNQEMSKGKTDDEKVSLSLAFASHLLIAGKIQPVKE